MEEFKLPNVFRVEFEDNTHLDQFNESFIYEKKFYGEAEDCQVLDIENFFYMCRTAALAMGFAEKTVDEWFEC